MCEIVMNAIELDIPVRRLSAVSEEKHPAYAQAANLACERARKNFINETPVLIVTPGISKAVAYTVGLEATEVEDAILLLRDALVLQTKRQIVVRAEIGEFGEVQ
jgi:hypothetical protein